MSKAPPPMRQWCAEHGVSEPSFYAWRRELKRREETQVRTARRPALLRQPRRMGLLPVQVATAPRFASEQPATVMLRLAGGLRLNATLEQLAAVLDVLEERSAEHPAAIEGVSLRRAGRHAEGIR